MKALRKLKKRIRKLEYFERVELMDWMNAWWSDLKEQRRMEEAEYLEDNPDARIDDETFCSLSAEE